VIVELIFTDHHHESVTVETAWRLCSAPQTAGKIIDALTTDRELQSALRRRMDRDYYLLFNSKKEGKSNQ
jgi:hypothetical protein